MPAGRVASKFACMHATCMNWRKQWQLRTFLPRARDCRNGRKPFAPQMEALVETRLAVPSMRGNPPGRGEQQAGNVQGYVRVLHWAVAGDSGTVARVRWGSGPSVGPI